MRNLLLKKTSISEIKKKVIFEEKSGNMALCGIPSGSGIEKRNSLAHRMGRMQPKVLSWPSVSIMGKEKKQQTKQKKKQKTPTLELLRIPSVCI